MRGMTLQELVALAVDKCGGQSELARTIARRFGVRATQQQIEYLLRVRGKPARRSSLTPYIAKIAGQSPTWAPSAAEGKRDRKADAAPLHKAKLVAVKIKGTGRVETVELTTEALQLAKLFMDLDADDRREVLAKAGALDARRRSVKGPRVPDEKLRHLAAPGTPTAQATAAKRKRAPSTQ